MKYIVEVREPVPSNLDEIAGKVAASFHISDDKALALLRRAPGAVTRAVSEREADVVSGIFERAGLSVVKRPVEEAPSTPPAYEPQDEGDAADAAPGAASSCVRSGESGGIGCGRAVRCPDAGGAGGSERRGSRRGSRGRLGGAERPGSGRVDRRWPASRSVGGGRLGPAAGRR